MGNQQSSSGATGIHSPPPTTPGSVEPESVFYTFSQTFTASLEEKFGGKVLPAVNRGLR